jgi:hypothetical protein
MKISKSGIFYKCIPFLEMNNPFDQQSFVFYSVISKSKQENMNLSLFIAHQVACYQSQTL